MQITLDTATMQPKHAAEALELILDRFTMTTVIDMLASLASEKAEHVRVNWQDEATAKQWDRLSRTLDKCTQKVQRVDYGISSPKKEV